MVKLHFATTLLFALAGSPAVSAEVLWGGKGCEYPFKSGNCVVDGNPSCDNLATAESAEGNKFFPGVSKEGWKLPGPPSTWYSYENGDDGELTGGAKAEPNWFLEMREEYKGTFEYTVENWTPSYVIVKGGTNATIYAGKGGGDEGLQTPKNNGGSTSDISHIEFCYPGPKEASSGGDPHFKTWAGKKFDYHGGCDLVLIQNPGFSNGLGLHVHGRTKIDTWWSYIESAAIRIGDHTLEVTGGDKQVSYWLDGVEVVDMEDGDAALGDFPIRFKKITDHQGRARIDLGGGNALSIETYKKFVKVNVKAGAAAAFEGSHGMLGSYPGGQRVARDKVTIVEDANDFGQEWQVLATDPKLFHSEGPVQPPMKCLMPDTTKKSQKRRLGESMITKEDAALACARVSEDDRDACIFDVLATNDKNMAGSY